MNFEFLKEINGKIFHIYNTVVSKNDLKISTKSSDLKKSKSPKNYLYMSHVTKPKNLTFFQTDI